jgi:hypothetical protein
LLGLCHEDPSSVESPGCSTSPPTPGCILHDANLDKVEPCRSDAVSPSTNLASLSFAVGYRCQSPTVRRDLVPIFPSTKARATWSRRSLHSRQDIGCRSRTTRALDSSTFTDYPRGHRVSSLVRLTSDSTTLTRPVVHIAEGTVMKHR